MSRGAPYGSQNIWWLSKELWQHFRMENSLSKTNFLFFFFSFFKVTDGQERTGAQSLACLLSNPTNFCNAPHDIMCVISNMAEESPRKSLLPETDQSHLGFPFLVSSLHHSSLSPRWTLDLSQTLKSCQDSMSFCGLDCARRTPCPYLPVPLLLSFGNWGASTTACN